MTTRRQLMCWMLATLACFVAGCGNKGNRAGKVTVELSERLKAKGVSLEDWRYSDSQKSFGVKLKASQPVDKHTYLVIRWDGFQGATSLTPSGDRINAGEWLDFGGSKALGDPFQNFPESGTVTIDVNER